MDDFHPPGLGLVLELGLGLELRLELGVDRVLAKQLFVF